MSDLWMGKITETIDMFLFLAVELTLLFIVISFLVGVIQHFLPAEKVQKILSSDSGRGYFSAAALGAITPFCSCSTIPMLTGLLKARAGFGPVLTFLFTSPLLNPVMVGLFLVTFGLKATIIYASMALSVAVIASYILHKLGFERYVRPELLETAAKKSCKTSSCGSAPCGEMVKDSPLKIAKDIFADSWSQFRKVFPFLLLGVSIGSITHGFMPADFIAEYAGADNLWAVPIAAVIGIPLYINISAMIPISGALLIKGMSMGSVMALIIGSAGASLTEVILLKSLFQKQMILAFLTVVLGMAVATGFLFNLFY